jgi:plasmid maintenance system killer protein
MIYKGYSKSTRKKLSQIRKMQYAEIERKKMEKRKKPNYENVKGRVQQKTIVKGATKKIEMLFKKEREKKLAKIALKIINEKKGDVAWGDVYSLTINQFGREIINHNNKSSPGEGTVQRICKTMIKAGIIKITQKN